MKILILGAGGTGGYFGGRLAQAGADVTFLLRETRAAHIARDGLIIETPTERAVVRVQTVLAATVKPEYEVIILACKAYDLASSIAAIRPAMHHRSQIVPLLNGLSHLDTLDTAFGSDRVMGGSCQIAVTLTADGVVKNLAEHQTILWGARHGDANQVQVAAALGEAFARTSVDWRVAADVMQDMWEKFTFLCTLAGMTSLMRASLGDILATDDGKQHLQRFFDNCVAVAVAEGRAPRAPVMTRFHGIMHSQGSTLTASMLRDIEAGNEIEAAHIVGDMLTRARRHGIDDTMLSIALTHLQAYQQRRKLAN